MSGVSSVNSGLVRPTDTIYTAIPTKHYTTRVTRYILLCLRIGLSVCVCLSRFGDCLIWTACPQNRAEHRALFNGDNVYSNAIYDRKPIPHPFTENVHREYDYLYSVLAHRSRSTYAYIIAVPTRSYIKIWCTPATLEEDYVLEVIFSGVLDEGGGRWRPSHLPYRKICLFVHRLL